MGLIFYSFLIFKPFAKNSLANIKLSKTQLPKLVQSGEILGRLIRPLIKTGLPLMKNLLNVLIPLEPQHLSEPQHWYLKTKKSKISWKLLILLKNVVYWKIVASETIEIKQSRFLSMLLGALGASSLGNLLAGKGVTRAGEGTIRAGQYFWCCLIFLNSFEIQKCY